MLIHLCKDDNVDDDDDDDNDDDDYDGIILFQNMSMTKQLLAVRLKVRVSASCCRSKLTKSQSLRYPIYRSVIEIPTRECLRLLNLIIRYSRVTGRCQAVTRATTNPGEKLYQVRYKSSACKRVLAIFSTEYLSPYCELQ